MAPIALADWAKAPARIKIHIIRSMFLSAAPSENRAMRALNDKPSVRATATIEATMKATVMGTA